MSQKHTPGPWIFEAHNMFGETPFEDEGEWPFGYISTDHPSPIFGLHPVLAFPREELAANARLIAAAPEILEALTALCNVLSNPQGPPHDLVQPTYDRARAAISKATGGQP